MANAQPIVNKTPGSPTFGVTNNVTRETFNFIRDHKGCSRAQVIDSLHARGFNANSVGSLIAQLALSNQISRENDKLVALIPEYRPIKTRSRKKAQEVKKKVVTVVRRTVKENSPIVPSSAGLAALANADARQVSGNHYKDMPIQPWSVMEAVLTKEEFIGFLKGNIIKYSMRAGRKEGSDDAGKAQHYQQKLKEIEGK